MNRRTTGRLVLLAAAVVIVAAGCSNTDKPDEPDVQVGGDNTGERDIAAQVASCDIVAGRKGRFIVGVLAADKSRLVAFGAVTFRFAPVTAQRANAEPVTAGFLPIPGQQLDPDASGPRFVTGSEAIGVYGAYDVVFDDPGIWEVTVEADIDGGPRTATAAFEVLADSPIPAPGDPAPRSTPPLAGNESVPAKAIDSRAGPDEPVPDPELHSITVADAVAAGMPVMVVVSTPTYCQSRFCGPITDSVATLARRHGDRIAFVHLEVWADFEAKSLNPAAADWIFPSGAADAREPWVFAVGRDGTIVERFDNVATEPELDQAVKRLLVP